MLSIDEIEQRVGLPVGVCEEYPPYTNPQPLFSRHWQHSTTSVLRTKLSMTEIKRYSLISSKYIFVFSNLYRIPCIAEPPGGEAGHPRCGRGHTTRSCGLLAGSFATFRGRALSLSAPLICVPSCAERRIRVRFNPFQKDLVGIKCS